MLKHMNLYCMSDIYNIQLKYIQKQSSEKHAYANIDINTV